MKKRNKSFCLNDDGFTLIEMVIVLSIIGIILSIAVPSFMKTLESARLKADQASARTIAIAAELALMDGVAEVTVDNLVKGGYLDSNIKPQSKDKDSFYIKINNDTKSVSVGYSENDILYPSKDKENDGEQ